MKINGETKIIGFFGSTYKTSKMYAMYNAAFEALNLSYVYVPFVVSNLKKAAEGIRHLGIHAVGVTIPYKVEIIPYLDELDQRARKIGAVNVVLNKNGRLIGGNTDGDGAIKALKEKTEIKRKKIVLLGAGGAARAITHALADDGGITTILNRTVETAEELAKTFRCNFGSLAEVDKELKNADILINSTSVGMMPHVNESLVEANLLPSNLTVMELVTNPKETKLIKDAKEVGCQIVYGERMLFWQAVLKFKLFTGVEAPIEVMERALYA